MSEENRGWLRRNMSLISQIVATTGVVVSGVCLVVLTVSELKKS